LNNSTRRAGSHTRPPFLVGDPMVKLSNEEVELKDERDEAIEVFVSFDSWRSMEGRGGSEAVEGEPRRIGGEEKETCWEVTSLGDRKP